MKLKQQRQRETTWPPEYMTDLPEHSYVAKFTTPQLKEILGDWEDRVSKAIAAAPQKVDEKKIVSHSPMNYRAQGYFELAQEMRAVDELGQVMVPGFERWRLLENCRLELVARREYAQRQESKANEMLTEKKADISEKFGDWDIEEPPADDSLMQALRGA